MIKSMTGFAAVSGEVPGGRLALELKSVNHRYLEFQTRMPEDLRAFEAQMRELVAAYQEKLTQKIADAMAGTASDERLKQEVVLFASRIDVAEELNRLSAHVSEVRRVLKAGGATGKRLDFLMQELNRESNTLGSKSVSTESTSVAIELKVAIEQMREQIQNIE